MKLWILSRKWQLRLLAVLMYAVLLLYYLIFSHIEALAEPAYADDRKSVVIEKFILPQTESEWAKLLIQQKAKEAGLSDKDIRILIAIAECESGIHSKPNKQGSGAFGIFQIMPVHNWRGDRFSAEGNIEIAIELYKEQSVTPWQASAACYLRKIL
jgi:hypothetical protein